MSNSFMPEEHGVRRRRFNSFRELAEYLKGLAYEEPGQDEFPDFAAPAWKFGSFRELSEYLKTQAEAPDSNAGHYAQGGYNSFSSPYGGKVLQASAKTGAGAKGSASGGVLKDFEKSLAQGREKGKEVVRGVLGYTLRNHSDIPIPYKPEAEEGVRYCQKGETCVVDGVYSPHGNKGKRIIVKIPDNCIAEVHKDGKLTFAGRTCGKIEKPRLVTRKDIIEEGEFKGWPNPYSGDNWDGERWSDNIATKKKML